MDKITQCRCCNSQPASKSLKDSYIRLGNTEIYADIMKECFEIHLATSTTDDGICDICISRLCDAWDFKQQVQRCQKEFQVALVNNVKESKPTVKQEWDIDFEDDDDDQLLFDLKKDVDKIKKEGAASENVADLFDLKEITVKKTRNVKKHEKKPAKGKEKKVSGLVKVESSSESELSIMPELIKIESKMESSSESEFSSTPEEIKKEANSVLDNLIPEKSRARYLRVYENFIQWKNEKKAHSLSESVFLAYFSELSKQMKPSTLWVTYSMIKSTIYTKNNVDIRKYKKLRAILKRNSKGYKPTKSKVLTAENVQTFLNEAPNDIYLVAKVALILGINGACRCSELTYLTINDVELHDDMLHIKLGNKKPTTARVFMISNEFMDLVRKYQAMRPKNCNNKRFFLNFKNGKCTKQVIGRHTFGRIPKDIATFLKLPNPEAYTGHCFRRTAATLLADSGANLTTLKLQGGWKSDRMAKSYIKESVGNKYDFTNNITKSIILRHRSTSPRPSTSHTREETCTSSEDEFITESRQLCSPASTENTILGN